MALWKRKQRAPLPAFAEDKLPRHVAVIMDGNGRWAQRRGLPRALGHRAGMETMVNLVRESSDLGIEALTLYAFSTENWARSHEEVGVLMGLLLEFCQKKIDELHENNVAVHILGDVEGLPAIQREAVKAVMERTGNNRGLKLSIALNYGGRTELAAAARRLAQKALEGTIGLGQIDENLLANELDTAGLPELDLLIRTSGEQRLSNFLLFQCAYAEFVFVDTLWPDFDSAAFHACLEAYGGRKRNFGGRPQGE